MKFNALGSMFLVVAFCVSGCVTTKSERLTRSFTPTSHELSSSESPMIGEVRSIEVGESLITKERQAVIAAIELTQAVQHSTENVGSKFILSALPGKYIESGRDSSGRYFQAEQGKILLDGKPIPAISGIYISDSNSNITEFYVVSNQGVNAPLLYPRNGIQFTRSTHTTRDSTGFKRELVYTGISQNTVSILYREFKDDLARPAFSQDLKYDLSEGRVVGYRGARFELVKATNQGLTYKLLKHLD